MVSVLPTGVERLSLHVTRRWGAKEGNTWLFLFLLIGAENKCASQLVWRAPVSQGKRPLPATESPELSVYGLLSLTP